MRMADPLFDYNDQDISLKVLPYMMTTSVGNNSLVLSTEDKEKYLEQPIHAALVAAAPHQAIPAVVLATHNEWVKNQKEVAVLMLLSMDLKIQQNLAHLGAYDMLQELKAMYAKQAEHELLQTVREFHVCKQEEGQSVSSYVLNMKSYIDNLERLGQPVTLKLGKDAPHALHAIRAGKVQKNKNKKPSKAAKGVQGKGKTKLVYAPEHKPSYAPKPKNPPPPKKDNHAKDAICYQCGKGLQGSKKLNLEALSLYMGNGQRAAVEAIRNYHLCLPSGLVIVLNNCHYAPTVTRGIILVSRLYDDGFINRFDLNNAISVSKNNIVYFSAIPKDGIYEIDLSSSNTNDSYIYAVSNKRAKLNLDSSLLWHCRLGHISKKRIEKLQHDGLLNSIDIESLEK
ncbi:zinc finger, CCHC-type containing protein [Tanacetum coccineum]|uniref:Zinc finger, CCHC-type containing protein n=1 Tax=Tanacetum coccineum TaxID=301880 RepID=A0ABQ5HWB0_9ASTR